MSEALVESAMQWSLRTGKFQHGDRSFLEFAQMLQDSAISPQQLVIGQEIGKGTFGSINRATFKGRPVAVKFVSKDVVSGPKSLPQVMHEVQLELKVVKMLNHPSICHFFGTASRFPGPNDSPKKWSIGMVFELCDQGDIHAMIHQKRKQFPLQMKLKWAAEVADGLAYIHSLKIVHRDLSSRNLLLTSDNKVKICDFGCARVLYNYSHLPSFISGSPPWMAPEQIMGSHLTVAVDVYAFGSILWELLTHQVPFSHRTATPNVDDLQRALKFEKPLPPPADASMGSIPADVKTSIRRLIRAVHSSDPSLRPPAEMLKEVAGAILVALEPGQGNRRNDHTKLMHGVEFRAELGKRLTMFYKKHNPKHLTKLDNIPNVLNKFGGDLPGLNESLREKYKADLNSLHGMKPLVPPEPVNGAVRHGVSSESSPNNGKIKIIPRFSAAEHVSRPSTSASASSTNALSDTNGRESYIPSTMPRPPSGKEDAQRLLSNSPSKNRVVMTSGSGTNSAIGQMKPAGQRNPLSRYKLKVVMDGAIILHEDKSPPKGKLPEGWSQERCDTTGRTYFSNRKTGALQWHMPTTADGNSSAVATADAHLRNGNVNGLQSNVKHALPSGSESGYRPHVVAKAASPVRKRIENGLQPNENHGSTLVKRAHEMEAKLRQFYRVWGVTNKDKLVPRIVAQHVGEPESLNLLLRERFYGTDLNCSATDLERVAEEQRRIVHDRIKVRTDKQYGFIRHDEGFEC